MSEVSLAKTDQLSAISLVKVVRAEWIKLRSLRSTWITLALGAALLIGVGLLASAMGGGGGPGSNQSGADTSTRDPVSLVMTGANLAVLVFGVMGAMLGAREYSSGLIRTTLSAVPKRLPVLWGKVAALAATVVPVTVVGVLIVYFGGMQILSAAGDPVVAWGDAGVARAVLGTAGYLSGVALLGMAFGFLLRNTAAAIGLLLGGVLIVPGIAGALLPDSWQGILKFLPSNAASAFTSVAESSSTLSPAVGAVVFIAWIVGLIGIAAVMLVRRDA